MVGCAAESEAQRLAALRRYQLLDTPPEEAFDRLTRIVKNVLGMPMAAIGLIDETRLWFKAKQGPLGPELPREITFCNDTIRGAGLLQVTDAAGDARYADNPLVSGEPHLRFYAGVPLRSHDGRAVGTLCCLDIEPRELRPHEIEVLCDLAHVVVDEFELRLVARTDHLTGLRGRRAFRLDAERDLATVAETGAPFSCIAFDVDLFKRINDSFGHAVGDAVLKNVARQCDLLLHEHGYAGRLGGEEFGIALPGLDAVAATRVAETLREIIAEMVTFSPTGPVTATISAGIATSRMDAKPLEELLAEADRAVYAAKGAGRNLCVRSDEIDFVERQLTCVA